ncbi:hypothetical protein [Spirosoma endbachense]|uniref:Uncharacterized protein n=1 Tax=Spirosoma endbachense TaxID=2666025 RepID=A0A6P1VWD5_9BACT|nr:hypothetical protein [Spirosoma endbachense]QHV95686.1 hypothetical protein GJR95_12005 [Spirosoma endbachense]
MVDIRFTRGWSDLQSGEYWSYAFVWCLDGSPLIGPDSIARNLNQYYDGLVARNSEKRNIPVEMVFKTNTVLNPLAAEGTDIKTFQGTISMLDYMGKRPMTLHLIVHLKSAGLTPSFFISFPLSLTVIQFGKDFRRYGQLFAVFNRLTAIRFRALAEFVLI